MEYLLIEARISLKLCVIYKKKGQQKQPRKIMWEKNVYYLPNVLYIFFILTKMPIKNKID